MLRKVVKLSMQCCGQILQDSFESLKTINNNTKLNLFHCYNKHFIITIIEKNFGHTFDVRKHAAVRLYKLYVLIYCTRIYLVLANILTRSLNMSNYFW